MKYNYIPNTGDLNDTLVNGFYVCNGDASHLPSTATYFVMVTSTGNYILQYATNAGNNVTYTRTYYNDNWTSWKEVTTDMPSFYKDYQNLSSLITGINYGNSLYIVPEVINISADRDETILRYLCNRYPSTVSALYVGRFSYVTQGFFAIMIYSTNDIVSTTNLPRYSFGLLCQWSGIFNFFNTSEGVLSTLWSAT